MPPQVEDPRWDPSCTHSGWIAPTTRTLSVRDRDLATGRRRSRFSQEAPCRADPWHRSKVFARRTSLSTERPLRYLAGAVGVSLARTFSLSAATASAYVFLAALMRSSVRV